MKTRILLAVVLSFISLFSFSQNVGLQWAKGIGGSGNDQVFSSVTDSDGNIYSVGGFNGTVDFDPGVGVFNLVNNNPISITQSLFLLKTDSAGNFLWAKTTQGILRGAQIKIDHNSNIIIAGTFEGNMDFDFGLANYTVGTQPLALLLWDSYDCFILKMDSLGTFQWVKTFGGDWHDQIMDLSIDDQNNIVCLGEFGSTVDFDPGSGVSNLSGSAGESFIHKLNSNGNFVWAKQFDVEVNIYGDITIDNYSNIYFSGGFIGTVDFDPNTSSTFFMSSLSYSGFPSSFFCKLNSAGNFVWAKAIHSSITSRITQSVTDTNGNLYATGNFWGIMDFDPGAGTYMDTSQTNPYGAYTYSTFSIKLSDSGLFQWANVVRDSNYVFGSDIVLNPIGNLFIKNNLHIQKLDTLGNTIWVENFPLYGKILNVTSNDDIFIYGN